MALVLGGEQLHGGVGACRRQLLPTQHSALLSRIDDMARGADGGATGTADGGGDGGGGGDGCGGGGIQAVARALTGRRAGTASCRQAARRGAMPRPAAALSRSASAAPYRRPSLRVQRARAPPPCTTAAAPPRTCTPHPSAQPPTPPPATTHLGTSHNTISKTIRPVQRWVHVAAMPAAARALRCANAMLCDEIPARRAP